MMTRRNAVIVCFAACATAFFAGCDKKSINSTAIEESGDTFAVSVFTLPEPLRIPVCYQPGDLESELKRYPWLRPFLFTQVGIEKYIPRTKWSEYADFDFNDKVYDDITKRCDALNKVVLVSNREFWSGVRLEISEVVLCESGKSRYLDICFKGFEADGKKLASQHIKLSDLHGKWKRTSDKDRGHLAEQLMNCYEKAMKLVEDGQLQTNPIKRLK
jgi:hypothetical protein